MSDIADDTVVMVDLREYLAAAQEPFLRRKVEDRRVPQASERVGFSILVGRKPDVSHAAAGDQFLKIVRPELGGFVPTFRVRFVRSVRLHAGWPLGVYQFCTSRATSN